jgi:hypothetical protein
MNNLPKQSLPNVPGFRFIGIFADGSEKPLQVLRHADGGCTLGGDVYRNLTGWREIPARAGKGGGK